MTLQCSRWVEWIPHPERWVLGKAVSVYSPLTPAWPYKNRLEPGIFPYWETKSSHSLCWAYGLGKDCLSLFQAWCVLLCSAKRMHQWPSRMPQLPVFQTLGGRIGVLVLQHDVGYVLHQMWILWPWGTAALHRAASCAHSVSSLAASKKRWTTWAWCGRGLFSVASNHAWSLSWVTLVHLLTLAALMLYSLSCRTAWHPENSETCCGQWDINRYDANWCLKCACVLWLTSLHYYDPL